jgi:hypothetical protein
MLRQERRSVRGLYPTHGWAEDRAAGFSPFPSGVGNRQGDVFFAPTDDLPDWPVGEGKILEGVPDILRNIRVSDADGNQLGIRTIREYTDVVRTKVFWPGNGPEGQEQARPVYLVEMEIPDSEKNPGIVISHRDHAPVRIWTFRGQNMFLAAEARGATDYRPTQFGGD